MSKLQKQAENLADLLIKHQADVRPIVENFMEKQDELGNIKDLDKKTLQRKNNVMDFIYDLKKNGVEVPMDYAGLDIATYFESGDIYMMHYQTGLDETPYHIDWD